MAGKETLLTWEDFLHACRDFEKVTENLEPSWHLVRQSDAVGDCYLKCFLVQKLCCDVETGGSTEKTALADVTAKTTRSDCLVRCEYHVIYSPSYSVPVLFFNISRSDGRLMSLDEIWAIFQRRTSSLAESDMWSTITQQDHPILQVPYFTFHPCHTGRMMGTLWKNPSKPALSYLVSWLSIVGGKIGVPLSNELLKVSGCVSVEEEAGEIAS